MDKNHSGPSVGTTEITKRPILEITLPLVSFSLLYKKVMEQKLIAEPSGSWYSNAGGVAKEIDHNLVSTRLRILQKCRIFRSAEFFATDHRLFGATLKLHVKSKKPPRCLRLL